MPERSVKAGEFKARCLQLMDEVAATGETIVVTKRGKPVARLSSATAPGPSGKSRFGYFKHLPPTNPHDSLFSAWDGELEAALDDGLERTAQLIDGTTVRPKTRKKR